MCYKGDVPYQCGNLDDIIKSSNEAVSIIKHLLKCLETLEGEYCSDYEEDILKIQDNVWKIEEIRDALGGLRREVDEGYYEPEYSLSDSDKYKIGDAIELQEEAFIEFMRDRFDVDKFIIEIEWNLYKSNKNIKSIDKVLQNI